MNLNHSMTLNEAPIGRQVRICHLQSRPHICNRLREMGLFENAIVRCIMMGHSNIICEICNTRIGLTKDLANEIVVSPI